MSTFPSTEESLAVITRRWVEIKMEHFDNVVAHMGAGSEVPVDRQAHLRFLEEQIREAAPHLHAFVRDNGHLNAEELEALAGKLSPGGAHDGALLALLVWKNLLFADPLLLAATFWHNWHGGKVGFQFLSDPAVVTRDEYQGEVENLLTVFAEGISDPRQILTGKDLAFYEALPEHLTVYRGCAGISAEVAGCGVCWTTRRDIAEWFALRGAGASKQEPVVVTARVRKFEIYFAKASEYEVVVVPRCSRPIACRQRKRNLRADEMVWQPD